MSDGKTDPDQQDRPDNAAQLRDQIDRGGTGDKVAFSDPAAAPLGTDDEAAGHPPRPEDVRRAAMAETRYAEAAEDKPDPADRQAGVFSVPTLLMILAALVALGLIAALFA